MPSKRNNQNGTTQPNNGETENGIFVSDNSVFKINVKWACGFVVAVFSEMRPKGGVVAASATNIREGGRFVNSQTNYWETGKKLRN